tara:strand:- start:53 stop:370 length:318 start_codon:yes stop_codon:yes gene_type:complete
MVLSAVSPEFLSQYSNALALVQSALSERRNIVIVGNKGANGKTFLQNEIKNDTKFTDYSIFYGEIDNDEMNSCFWLETVDSDIVDKMTAQGIDFCRVDMPISLLA